MSDVIVNQPGDESPEAAPIVPVEAPTNDADVAIASIEAERDVALGAQQMEASIVASEVAQEIETIRAESEGEQWTTQAARISHLEGEMESLKAQVTGLTSPPLSSAEAAEIVEEIAETLTATEPPSIPTSMPDATSKTQTEHGGASVAAEAALDIPPLVEVERGGPIIKLV